MSPIGELIECALGTKAKAATFSDAITSYGMNAITPSMGIDKICAVFSCTKAIARQINAILELAYLFKPNVNDHQIRDPRQVFELCSDMQMATKETLRGFYLNNRNKVIHVETISIGTATANLVDAKIIVRPALLLNAPLIILAHNHPSGDPDPSDEDIQVTNDVQRACTFLSLRLVDHVIIGNGKYVSLNQMGHI
jgi:DNA repair protein RadC